MDLSLSNSLKRFPDITGVVPNLEHLNLSFCSELEEIHHSVFLHKNIIHLQLSSCVNLKILPSSIQMKSLRSLHLNGCSSLERFPEVTGEMGKPLVLDLEGCDLIRALPSSIQLLTGLIILTKRQIYDVDFEKHNWIMLQHIDNHTRLNSIRVVDVKHEDFVARQSHYLRPLREILDLRDNFKQLFSGVSQFTHLRHADLSCCINLKEQNDLTLLIQVLRADCCTYLWKIEDTLNKYKWLFKIPLRAECLRDLEDQESLSHLSILSLNPLVERCAALNHHLSYLGPVRTIPNWFRDRQWGNEIALNIPQNQITNILLGVAICCLSRESPESHSSYPDLLIEFNSSLQNKLVDWIEYVGASLTRFWMFYMPVEFIKHQWGISDLNKKVISLKSDNYMIIQCGVRLVYQNDIKLVP